MRCVVFYFKTSFLKFALSLKLVWKKLNAVHEYWSCVALSSCSSLVVQLACDNVKIFNACAAISVLISNGN